MLISENFAREYWGSARGRDRQADPLESERPWSEIIGVAADIRHDGADKQAPSTVYWPLRSPRIRWRS